MSELICNNYPMLLVLNRFGINMGFSDNSIEQVCTQHNIDVNTFLAVANLLISKDKSTYNKNKYKISIETILEYLLNSHRYFMEYKFPSIREKLSEAIACDNAVSLVILNYYDQYVDEVRKHMEFEEQVVFTYIKQLLDSKTDGTYSIETFSDHHENTDPKLTELKNIIIKFYPTKSSNELISALFDIFTCQEDLASHTNIEDYLLIPAVLEIERANRQ